MTLSGRPVEERIQSMLAAPEARSGDSEALLTDGYAKALALDAERLRLERRITLLAARAEEREAAHELRGAWLRHRTIVAELRELRAMLRRLRDDDAAA